MDIPNLGASFSMVSAHFELFAVLLFALPLISFLSIRLWIAARANKVQRTSDWFVPADLESEAARIHYAMGRNPVAFAHARRDPRARQRSRR